MPWVETRKSAWIRRLARWCSQGSQARDEDLLSSRPSLNALERIPQIVRNVVRPSLPFTLTLQVEPINSDFSLLNENSVAS
jgi:hypothetical protein